jgi:hypothetical protein
MNIPDGLKPSTAALTAAVMPAVRECEAARVFNGPKGQPSHAAWWGIAIHRYIQYAKTKDPEFALEYIDTKFKRSYRCCASIDLTEIPDGSHETHLAYSIDTRVPIRGKGTINAEEHVHGRADLTYAIEADYENAVLDWKTGKATDHDATDNEQLLVLASALWLENPAHMDKPIHSALVAVRSNGMLDWYPTIYTPEKLEAFVKETRQLVFLVGETRADFHDGGVMPSFTPGDHCKTCFCVLACPYTTPEALKYKNGK